MPSLFCFTTWSLRASIFARSRSSPFTLMPWSAKCLPACSKVFGRLQQRLGRDAAHVRAGAARAAAVLVVFHSSMQAVLKPSCAARIARYSRRDRRR
jgi:hypothetical protein